MITCCYSFADIKIKIENNTRKFALSWFYCKSSYQKDVKQYKITAGIKLIKKLIFDRNWAATTRFFNVIGRKLVTCFALVSASVLFANRGVLCTKPIILHSVGIVVPKHNRGLNVILTGECCSKPNALIVRLKVLPAEAELD